jgi:hypothetical protein
MQYIHGHGKSPFFRVSRRQRHPSDIERVRERAECLGPHDAKVSDVSIRELGKDAVENVA